MIVHFYLRYSTRYGQSLLVSGSAAALGNDDDSRAFELSYLNDQLWHGSLELDTDDLAEPLCYRYILRDDNDMLVYEFGNDRIVDTAALKAAKIILYDTWNHAGQYENVFYTGPFSSVLLKPATLQYTAEPSPGKPTHAFRVKAPLLKANEIICLSGSGAALYDWDKEAVLLCSKQENWWTIQLDLSKASFPLEYKYGIYDTTAQKFVRFEDGNNRVLISDDGKDTLTIIHDGFARLNNINWKGAAVAIPVFSLRSQHSFGVGEFTDIKLLVDWARATGLKMIQLLPVNDTTSTFSWKDSYPYSAISAFALHPILLNLQAVAGKEQEKLMASLAAKQQELNKPETLDYETVIRIKQETIGALYKAQQNTFRDDLAYMTFFDLNRHWLEPYAAFCYLRDKYKTAQFSTWKKHAVYDESEIQELVSPQTNHYHEIAIHYFTQYHLHLQLQDATRYAHKHGIIIKGDIPIGISRNSADAWVEPHLYHMNEQAGAPPDAFTAKGQNWGFPTYNWEVMQQDGFSWWRKRFDQMSNYFDAFRIDHILGFFRIWSIPEHAVEGLLGRFVPALPVHINELFSKHILFERSRYAEPYITENILQDIFGEQTAAVKKTFFSGLKLKEKFNTQRKVEAYFKTQQVFDEKVKQGLYDVIANVIFFEVEDSNAQEFHFRISMQDTTSFKALDKHSQSELIYLYNNYFFQRQDELWKKEALKKLPELKRNTDMLVCGEDLGMVPHCVPEVMEQLAILSLEIQRMPKKTGTEFFHPNDAPYLSVVSPSTHDMSTVRAWWEENRETTKHFYQHLMGKSGEPPVHCEAWINKEIVMQHLYSPAMWSIFQLQDILGTDENIRREDPHAERINNPAVTEYYWNYRMHISLEQLLQKSAFNDSLKEAVAKSGR